MLQPRNFNKDFWNDRMLNFYIACKESIHNVKIGLPPYETYYQTTSAKLSTKEITVVMLQVLYDEDQEKPDPPMD